MKAVVAAFNQEKALVGDFSVITNLRMELFEALIEKCTVCHLDRSGSTLLHPELPDPGLVAADGVAGGGVAALHEGDQTAVLLRHLRTHLPLLAPAPASSRH